VHPAPEQARDFVLAWTLQLLADALGNLLKGSLNLRLDDLIDLRACRRPRALAKVGERKLQLLDKLCQLREGVRVQRRRRRRRRWRRRRRRRRNRHLQCERAGSTKQRRPWQKQTPCRQHKNINFSAKISPAEIAQAKKEESFCLTRSLAPSYLDSLSLSLARSLSSLSQHTNNTKRVSRVPGPQ